ncbi:ribosome maturation factor RimM [Edaphobacter acidisoli]|uniref:Ribosome maturation factor RimM n=1 Tax=Edaphobacter acidisoli TaxID=2040573 RepID=A0A916RFA3_9BACT|nr:ribosome maturation factor RimM [Edaphobacter acidisoli]GGA54027.1 ribosome maturation factor RimM [Edaphobacter acidisoli]
MSDVLPSWVVVAHLLRPQGRKGELLAELLTDFPERFSEQRRVFLAPMGFAGAPSAAREAEVRGHWLPIGKNEGRIVLEFAGIDSITAAEAVAGLDVIVPRENRMKLADDSVYISELAGCTVYDRSHAVGVVKDVQFATTADGARRLEDAAPLLVVEAQDGAEVLVPFAKAFIMGISIEAKRIDMELPEGLVDVNREDPAKTTRKR